MPKGWTWVETEEQAYQKCHDFNLKIYKVGCDARTPKSYKRKVKLRETKTLWVTETGERFKKNNLTTPGTDWPLYCLEDEPKLIEG